MTALNLLFSEQDLAKLSGDEREFLVERIDHLFNSPEVLKIVSQKLQPSVHALKTKIEPLGQPKTSFT